MQSSNQKERELTIRICDINGSQLAQLEVEATMSPEELRALARASLALTTSFKLLYDSLEVCGSGTLAAHGVIDGAQLTLVLLRLEDTLVMWSGYNISWTHTLAPSQKVAQMVVGYHAAFILLDDGTCWKVGPKSLDDPYHYEPLPAPQRLEALREACGGPIKNLGIDYTTLVAMAGDQVWLQDDVHCWGAIKTVLCQGEEDEGEAGDPDRLRARRICGRGVVNVVGDRSWGVVHAETGSVYVYAEGHAEPMLSASMEVLLQAHGGKLLAQVNVGDQRVCKVAMTQSSIGAGLVLSDGRVALLKNSAGLRMDGDMLSIPALPDLAGIVDITANARFVLDKHGHIWCIGDSQAARVAVIGGGHNAARLCGDVAAIASSTGGEHIYVFPPRGPPHVAVEWMQASGGCTRVPGFQAVGHMQAAVYFGMGYLSGDPPSYGLEGGLARCYAEGANLLAYQCGRYDELQDENGCDVTRLEALLEKGCDASSFAPEGEPLLLTFAMLGARGCPGFEEAVRLMMRHGANSDVQRAAVKGVIDAGNVRALEILISVGCEVTDADQANCRANEPEPVEDED